MRIIDISQEIRQDMTVYPGDPSFHSHPCSSFKQGDICEVSELTIGSHCGTHIDAPLHMIPGGATLETMPLDLFVGPCRVLTLPTHVITEKMLMEHDVQEGERILLRTDPGGVYTPMNGEFNPAVLSVRAAQYLADKHVRLIGIDAPTVENMEICDGEIHRTLLSAGIALLEGLCLTRATKEEYFLSALPLSLVGENGAPCRAVLIEE
ncbi:MAG: cyclase family protein [Clostridia bacterium]|nr:cyclase family protein [Clostridia bacterium]MBQ6857835.1 cyclase family protein [Clostridia bacterium]MBQ7051428.1 cyclase family protein [Clostridia bacterium]